ncbi:DNA-binding protein WhiA [Anaeromicropila herbilytica]|uniref:Probable cell division protein WhiA n=1 Tax=Anaeromicropila herbilytica TaxID=2785025 RepID=A0A7R7EP66_9FIRM|nr:DNA-binding protein WhiA [Anaeromicropila herbilytica]BCN32530.1 putative sporulation transcription regulator WhiA [Anaeromicropila herbilytica]
MSFSREVKDELSRQLSSARHCQIAEITAIISLCGRVSINEKEEYYIKIHTENLTVARKYYTLIKKTFQVNPEILVKRNHYLKKSKLYMIVIKDSKVSMKILKATKLIDSDGEVQENLSIVDNVVVQNTCCKRSFIRGAFLAAGSISDPEKTYHFEIVAATESKAKQIQDIIGAFDIDAKIILRKKYYVVYVKDGSQIVDLLNIMEAHISLMNLENVRILKEMRNSINRQVNCETANINKTVAAASKQVEDILYIKDTVGLSELSEGLEDIARLRFEYPESSLKELGELLNPPIGKSGVNHRLRKISIFADNLREQKEEVNHGIKTNNN